MINLYCLLDQDYGGSLDIHEISVFGSYMLGADWSPDIAVGFMQDFDTSRDGQLSLEEFCKFCEEMIYKDKDLAFIRQRAKVRQPPSRPSRR